MPKQNDNNSYLTGSIEEVIAIIFASYFLLKTHQELNTASAHSLQSSLPNSDPMIVNFLENITFIYAALPLFLLLFFGGKNAIESVVSVSKTATSIYKNSTPYIETAKTVGNAVVVVSKFATGLSAPSSEELQSVYNSCVPHFNSAWKAVREKVSAVNERVCNVFPSA